MMDTEQRVNIAIDKRQLLTLLAERKLTLGSFRCLDRETKREVQAIWLRQAQQVLDK